MLHRVRDRGDYQMEERCALGGGEHYVVWKEKKIRVTVGSRWYKFIASSGISRIDS